MFTVSDIAQKIKRHDEELVQAITRVRNWTKEGLLKPSGKANPGTGRARGYSKRALINAVLMQALVNTGISATRSAWLVGRVNALETFIDPRKSVLLFGQSTDTKEFFIRMDSAEKVHQMIIEAPPRDALTLIYLHRIFERLDEVGD